MTKILHTIESPADIRKLSIADLKILANDIRETVIDQVSKRGGHFASNLGSVELTLALHYVFNTPKDRLIWDVGHQAYPHKLITGRFKNFHTLKQNGGISGFLKRSESEYDTFGAGHASTSLAAALGFAAARTKLGRDNHVVGIIGDGSITGGMAYEALNNAGNEKITFVLNDNTMSIAPNVGALNKYLTKIIANPIYNKIKKDIWDLTGKFNNLGEGIRKVLHKMDEGVKHMFLPGGFFEDLGIRYFGPINGHNIEELIEIFTLVKEIPGPCMVHVLTEKGHGFEIAEKDSYKWHASVPFDVESGERKIDPNAPPTLAKVFGLSLLELARKDKRIHAITAAMPDGVGLNVMEKELPGQVIDVGIAEQYAVTYAAGMACEGMKPVCAIYSTFLQRALDQVIHDVAIQNLNVLFVMSHGGLVGQDGPTHHGMMDVTYMRMIPGMTIMAPSDEIELRNMLFTAMDMSGPIAIRFSKGSAKNNNPFPPFEKIEVSMPKVIEKGNDILILSLGSMLPYGAVVCEKLKADGYSPTLVDIRFVKPLNKKFYREYIENHSCIITLEDNAVVGGFGSGISELLQELKIYNKPIKHIGIPDQFVTHGDIPYLHKSLGMDSESIYNEALALLKLNPSLVATKETSYN